jgi:aryl-alcohol dehydrogenase-like predicted oxidoreductase
VQSLVEAAYRYALHTEPVTAVMCGTLERSELEENIDTFEKGPLPADKIERLKSLFGSIAEPIGN